MAMVIGRTSYPFVLSTPAPTKWYRYCRHFHFANLSTYWQSIITLNPGTRENLSNCCAANSRHYTNTTHWIILLILFFPKWKQLLFIFKNVFIAEKLKSVKKKESITYTLPSLIVPPGNDPMSILMLMHPEFCSVCNSIILHKSIDKCIT